ncbi:MAG TPA: efflux RND transporter periplasmic adaptor subunit [Bryobacteraceae bacterium]|nr:efflux RND transporter periplasmic adaptor subunit [Bryobacteraceae bacterium]
MRTRPGFLVLAILFSFLLGCGGGSAKKEGGADGASGAAGASGSGEAKADAGGDEAQAPTPVEVETVRKGPIDRIVTANAVLYPVNQANVTAKISSPVRRVLVNRGDHVKAGQLLIDLESADLAATANESKSLYDQAQAQLQTVTGVTVVDDRNKAQTDLQAATETLDAARKVYDSRVTLLKEGAIAQRQVDDQKVVVAQAQSAYNQAKQHLESLTQVGQREQVNAAQAQVNAAKAHYENSEVQVSYGRITSPIAGVVADRPVYPGDMPPSGTPLVSIVDISSVVARANIPVKEASLIKVGRPATISTSDGDLAGKVTVVSPAVDPNTTTVQVWVQAVNPGEKLKPGGTVTVSINAETLQDVTLVSSSALLNSDEGGQMVIVVTPDNVAHQHKVSVGVRQGINVQIVSGVNEGDKVVVSGGLGLDDGSKVVIKAAPSEDDDDDDAK